MKAFFRDGGHLLRVAAIFGIAVLAFLLVRARLVPADFGRYGHYRAGALADNRSRPAVFAGKAACLDCHSDVADAQKGSHHASFSCEACHGPLAAHADNPEIKPAKLDEARLCVTCHRATAGRPAKFPQVHPKEHSDGAPCTSCHKPHHPEQEERS
ncbi:MAG: multiheme c-type cytochrome [Thermoanaerobaculia bacterium]